MSNWSCSLFVAQNCAPLVAGAPGPPPGITMVCASSSPDAAGITTIGSETTSVDHDSAASHFAGTSTREHTALAGTGTSQSTSRAAGRNSSGSAVVTGPAVVAGAAVVRGTVAGGVVGAAA